MAQTINNPTQAIVRRYNGPQYPMFAISLDGVCGYCHNGNTVWQDDEGYDWDEYKAIVDSGTVVETLDEVTPVDMRDEIIRADAVLVPVLD